MKVEIAIARDRLAIVEPANSKARKAERAKVETANLQGTLREKIPRLARVEPDTLICVIWFLRPNSKVRKADKVKAESAKLQGPVRSGKQALKPTGMEPDSFRCFQRFLRPSAKARKAERL